jgi:hypothetical protein
MSGGVLFWMIVFALSTVCFFVVAAVVTVKGSHDLKDLLRDPQRTHRRKHQES